MAAFSLQHIKEIKKNSCHLLPEVPGTMYARPRKVHTLPEFDGTRPICIAEIKKASPSEGAIRHVIPSQQAAAYMKAGASAVSVLVDNVYFSGSFEDLRQVASGLRAPVLCKEFVCTRQQVHAAYTAGADLVLLIARMLDDRELAHLYTYTLSLGITPLVEIHEEEELSRVLPLSPEMLMVNMRNLDTLTIDMKTGTGALKAIPASIRTISASGIYSRQDVNRVIEQTGCGTFLVGTALMKADHPARLLKELTHAG